MMPGDDTAAALWSATARGGGGGGGVPTFFALDAKESRFFLDAPPDGDEKNESSTCFESRRWLSFSAAIMSSESPPLSSSLSLPSLSSELELELLLLLLLTVAVSGR
jgi:hypothetical protein